jgi:hypothetical protein
MDTTINTAYKMFMNIYDTDALKLQAPSRHEQIPIILAFMAVELNDAEKLEEISTKYGNDIFNSPINNWGSMILSQFDINTTNRPESPTSILDIETKIIN